DDVAHALSRPTGQLGKLFAAADAPAMGREPRPEHERHEDEVVVLADGAQLSGGLTHVPGRSQQLGVGVAQVTARQPAPLELVDQVAASQPVVDVARSLAQRRALKRLGPEAHGPEGYPLAAASFGLSLTSV